LAQQVTLYVQTSRVTGFVCVLSTPISQCNLQDAQLSRHRSTRCFISSCTKLINRVHTYVLTWKKVLVAFFVTFTLFSKCYFSIKSYHPIPGRDSVPQPLGSSGRDGSSRQRQGGNNLHFVILDKIDTIYTNCRRALKS
jgi:hypothetical protein